MESICAQTKQTFHRFVCIWRLFQVFHSQEVKRWNVAQVADLARSDDVSFFQLQYATPNGSVMTKNLDLDAFIGGAPKKHEEYPRNVIRAKCHIASNKRGGKPSKTPLTVGNYGNGWFIMCDLDSGSILNMTTMQELENNEVALTARPWRICRGFTPKWIVSYMIVLVQSYKKLQEEAFKEIWYYIVDRFHAHKHGKKCTCIPCRWAAI